MDEDWLLQFSEDLAIVRYTDDVTCVRIESNDDIDTDNGTENDIDVTLVIGAIEASPHAVLAAAFDVLGGSAAARSGADALHGATGHAMTVTSSPSDEAGTACAANVPSFTVVADHVLLAAGDALGLVAAGDRTRGHFPAISPVPLCVESARQALWVRLSAGGFDAAAVTGVQQMIGGLRDVPPNETRVVTVNFDHPFGFIARHRASGLILIAGWVAGGTDAATRSIMWKPAKG